MVMTGAGIFCGGDGGGYGAAVTKVWRQRLDNKTRDCITTVSYNLIMLLKR